MRGIAGLFSLNSTSVDLNSVVEMIQSLRHRGPDDSGLTAFDAEAGRIS